MKLVKTNIYIVIAFLLLLTTTLAHSQDDVMRVYSKDGAVYAINTAQVDSVTFAFDCEVNCTDLECMNMPRPEDSYNYPILPGMEEWKQLTVPEMVEVCQVPVEILQNMSTQAVIQALWEYPFFWEMMIDYYYQRDFETLFLQNNAYIELTKRGDAGEALLERLRLINPYRMSFKYRSLELVMSQEVFLSQLTDHDKCKLIEIVLMNDEWRQSCGSKSNYGVVLLLIGRTLANANYATFMEEVKKNEHLIDFLSGEKFSYLPSRLTYCCGNITEVIINCASKYIKEIKNKLL